MYSNLITSVLSLFLSHFRSHPIGLHLHFHSHRHHHLRRYPVCDHRSVLISVSLVNAIGISRSLSTVFFNALVVHWIVWLSSTRCSICWIVYSFSFWTASVKSLAVFLGANVKIFVIGNNNRFPSIDIDPCYCAEVRYWNIILFIESEIVSIFPSRTLTFTRNQFLFHSICSVHAALDPISRTASSFWISICFWIRPLVHRHDLHSKHNHKAIKWFLNNQQINIQQIDR